MNDPEYIEPWFAVFSSVGLTLTYVWMVIRERRR
jgi:hypothetical protein